MVFKHFVLLVIFTTFSNLHSYSQTYEQLIHKRDSLIKLRDSLISRGVELDNSLIIQKEKIDQLKLELENHKLSSQKLLDSLKDENIKLKSIMLLHLERMLPKKLDSIKMEDKQFKANLDLVNIRPGYYYYKRSIDENEVQEDFENEIEWFFIDENYQANNFFTGTYEYCLDDLLFTQNPKTIYRTIKKNKSQFEELLKGCEFEDYSKSYLISPNSIEVMKNKYFDYIELELLFSKGKLIRKSYDQNLNLIIDEFNFIGD